MAEKIISARLSDLGHLRGYERILSLSTVTDSRLELELRQAIWHLYKDWEVAAIELYDRAIALRRSGVGVQGINDLRDEIGRTQARLTLKPEQIVKARQQVRDGHVVLAKELRDELNAQIRS